MHNLHTTYKQLTRITTTANLIRISKFCDRNSSVTIPPVTHSLCCNSATLCFWMRRRDAGGVQMKG